MKLNKAIRAIVFLVVVILGFSAVSSLLCAGDGRYFAAKSAFKALYSIPDNSADVIYIGSSSAARSFIPPLIYEQTGISSILLAPPSASSITIKYLIAEALRTQSPKLIVIDLAALVSEAVNHDKGYGIPERSFRPTTDYMDILSPNRYEAICNGVDLLEPEPQSSHDKLSYVVPLIFWHSSWKDLPQQISSSIHNKQYYFMGYAMTFNRKPIKALTLEQYLSEPVASQFIDEQLGDLLKFIKNTDADYLFVRPPMNLGNSNNHLSYWNYTKKQLADAGYLVLDTAYDYINDIGIEWDKDFADEVHLHVHGAVKFTTFIGKWLKDKYNLPDHRQDKGYELWHETYSQLLPFIS
ncbi:MAG: hypothetical protein LBC27_05460 [Spirochaetaceae bacterium]|jgi:hypothetical protein|nr:hypothetical protein [Spirochaetaceae bacterium]